MKFSLLKSQEFQKAVTRLTSPPPSSHPSSAPLPSPFLYADTPSPPMSKDVEVEGAELRGVVEERSMLLEGNEDPQQAANIPQPDLKVTTADAFERVQ